MTPGDDDDATPDPVRASVDQSERDSPDHVELLCGLAATVIDAVRVEAVFEAALDALAHALRINRAAILVVDAEGVMRFRAWRNLSDGYRRAADGHAPWTRATPSPRPVVSRDVTAEPALAPRLTSLRAEGIAALGFIPLAVEGRLIGTLIVYHDHPGALDARELALAQAIANHVAAAISRFKSSAELQQTTKFNELFNGILGHDLRNPLAAMITAARLAMARTDDDKVLKPLSRILSSGDRMTRMIDQLLQFTRARAGAGVPLALGRLDVVPVLRKVMDELGGAMPERLPNLAYQGDTVGKWDGDRLSQVFSNLLANALQHGAASGGVDVLVDGSSAASVRIDVHNAGAIPRELLLQIFEPLAGGEAWVKRSRGLGLGLYIARELIRAHGGSIDVRSDEDTGTTFSVVLPRERDNAAP